MEIPPLRPSRNSLQQSPEARAQREEREAQARINKNQQQLEEAQREAETRMEHLRAGYETAAVAENARQDEAYQKQQAKGFEAIRDLQYRQQQELNRIRREGEAEMARLRDYYRNATHSTERHGEEELENLNRLQSTQSEYSRRQATTEMENLRQANQAEVMRAKQESDSRMAALLEADRAEFQRKEALTSEASETADERFRERFESQLSDQKSTLDAMNNRAAQKIRDVRMETAHKLAAYSSRQNDPFYKLVELDAELIDGGNHYELRATIPQHEQKGVSVSLKGEQLVLSGYRRNEEKIELAPGKTKGTATFQSFHESFPLATPVEAKKLFREFDGDQLIVRVPKKKEYQIAQPYQADAKKQASRARVEKPHFPENLPHVDRGESKPSGDDAPPKNTAKTRGSRTLS